MVTPPTSLKELEARIRSIPGFPKPGIVFRDITTLLKDPGALALAADLLAQQYANAHIAKVAAIESRGFILGALLASRLGCGFVPIRKRGKLPARSIAEEYALEYGTDAIEIHEDAIDPGERVLIHDDLLATGGTAAAACRLVNRLKGEIAGCAFLIELSFLNGRAKLTPHPVFSLIQYQEE